MGAVADGIRLAFGGIVQEAVDEDRAIRGHTYSGIHVAGHAFLIVNNLHTAPAKNVGRTNHYRVTDTLCDSSCLFYRRCHSGFRHGDFQFFHHSAEEVAVFCQINDRGGGSKDLHAVLFQIGSKIQRSLAAKLGDNAKRLFLIIYTQYIFQGQRFKIELVGSVIVCGNRFRITVDDDGLKTKLLQRQGSMYTAVVEFDTLSDTVWTASKDHDLRLFSRNRIFVRCIVSRIIVGAVLRTAYVNAFPCFFHTQGNSPVSNIIFRDFQNLT